MNCFTLIKDSLAKIKLPTLFEKERMAQILELTLFCGKKSNVASQLIDICKATNTFSILAKLLRPFINFEYLAEKQTSCKLFF